MKSRHLSLLAVAIAAVTSGMAQANDVSLYNIKAEWYGGKPADNVAYDNNPLSTSPTARWGVGANQSGYDFDVAAQPIIFIVPPSPTDEQVLGTFRHQNFPISANTSITEIKLRITADLSINNTYQDNLEFDYGFDHSETPNAASPCADGGAVGVGVNKDGCADLVTARWMPTSDVFLIGLDEYTLNVTGFSLDPAGSSPFKSFWTAEGKSNEAYLLGKVMLVSQIPDPPIPEPTTLALLGLGLAGLAVSRRKQ